MVTAVEMDEIKGNAFSFPYPLIEFPAGDLNEFYYDKQIQMVLAHVSPLPLVQF
jgi:hypothetical protein